MALWWAMAAVFVAGGVGGAVNAILTGNGGFVLPRSEVDGGARILRPGALGTVIAGGVAAVVSWGLYGPASVVLLGRTEPVALPLSALAGAVLVGVGGARWLTDHADKRLLRATAVRAAGGETARRIAAAAPVDAFRLVTGSKVLG